MPCLAVATVYGGGQNGSNLMYYFRIFNSEIIIRQCTTKRAVFPGVLQRFTDFGNLVTICVFYQIEHTGGRNYSFAGAHSPPPEHAVRNPTAASMSGAGKCAAAQRAA